MLRLYNTLTRSIQDFQPLKNDLVTIYSCGPTVYDYQHIGHMRRYVGDDVLVRVLKLSGYSIKHVMNITDVGHLVSDADEGEDKMEKGAKKFGLSVWDIAKKFEQQFFDSEKELGVKRPEVVIRATEAIQEQIELIKTLEEKGYTYKIADGVYFDTSKVKDYTKLSHQKLEELKAGARVEIVAGKKYPTDFALWKFSKTGEKRQMEWDSPWGVGFPGWHIECSAMSMKELGETLDIHTGGIDHIPIHHTNEIAQSESATGREFVRYWVHHNFLMVEGTKMSKSLGNLYTVQDLIEKGYDPLALRYLFLQTHYRQEMNFTWDALDAASTALERLKNEASMWERDGEHSFEYIEQFRQALNDDLNTSKAIGILWEMVHSDIDSSTKASTLKIMDDVLGLKVFKRKAIEVPAEVKELVDQRQQLRLEKKFQESDVVRGKINDLGYEVQDTDNGQPKIVKKRL